MSDFPIKVGNETEVSTYANSLTNGEEQLLITRYGKLYLTNGLGGYTEITDVIPVDTLPENGAKLYKMYLLSGDKSINIYDGSSWNKYGGIGSGVSTVASSTTNGNILINGVETKVYTSDGNATKLNNIMIDDSNRSNGRVLTYNSSTGKDEWADVTISGIVGSTSNIITPSGLPVTLNDGQEFIINHPSATDDKIIINLQEKIAGSSVVDTHVDFSDSSKYSLQDSGKILVGNNKAQLDINTKLLMHMDESTFKDEMGHTIINNGATFDITNKVFGNGSAYFNGSSNIYIVNELDDTNELSFDCWIRLASTPSNYVYTIMSGSNTSTTSTDRLSFYVNTSRKLQFDNGIAAISCVGSTILSLGTFYHVELNITNTTVYLFVNGNLEISVPKTQTYNGINYIKLGSQIGNVYNFIGNIDEAKMCNKARHTSNFILKTQAYQTPYTTGNTSFYLKTTEKSNFNLLTTDTITSLLMPITIPINTSCKVLFSVDNCVNWLYKDGTGIHKYTEDLTTNWTRSNSNTELQTYFTNLTITQLTSDLSGLGIVPINLDFVWQLNTTDLSVTPSISPITLNYTTKSHTELASCGGYTESVRFGVKRISNTQLSIKNLSTSTRTVSANVIIGS